MSQTEMGSKIERLKILKENGYPVPDFQTISLEDAIGQTGIRALEKVVTENKQDDVSNLSKKLKETTKKYYSINFQSGFSSDYYAARSSANLEDGENYSFAGQFDTYLMVGVAELQQRILDCFLSAYSENAIQYMMEKEIPIANLRMNVMVQEMIESDISGVCFTANPQGLLNEAVVVAGRGTGDKVVEDKVDVTTYYYSRTDDIYYYEGKDNLLSEPLLKEMMESVSEMEKIFGEYLDVEFAVKAGKLYFLQARDITTLTGKNPLILDNSNIVESYPGVSLPLTCSFVGDVYSGIFRSVSQRVLKNEKELKKHEAVFSNMVGSVNGRIYYKISNWYTVIKFLPMNQKIIPIWQEMLGVKNKSYDREEVKLSPFVRLGTYFNVITEMFQVPKNMEKLNRDFKLIQEEFYSTFREGMDGKEIASLYNKIQDKLFSCWDITLLNDTYSFLFTGLLKSGLKKKYENADEVTNRFISGISNIESLKPIKEMIRLAYEKEQMDEASYQKACEAYIELYGDRNLEELKLESKTFRSHPALLTERIEQYRQDMEKLKAMYENLNQTQEQKISGLKGRNKFFAKQAAKAISYREISRLNRSRIFGMVRLMMSEWGKNFARNGLLEDSADIFWITTKEVFSLLDAPRPMQETVAARKKEYELYRRLPAYTRLLFQEKEFDKKHTGVNSCVIWEDSGEIKGTPCSNGVAEGKALVVTDVTNIKDWKDKILITKMTDPGWVFLLASAKGVISEKGSLLSHTAIISRELKIPSIVGVEHLMEKIHDNDLIRMDGNTGVVEIIKASE